MSKNLHEKVQLYFQPVVTLKDIMSRYSVLVQLCKKCLYKQFFSDHWQCVGEFSYCTLVFTHAVEHLITSYPLDEFMESALQVI